ncbi:MAG: MATE family efflux transporter [Clostridiales bacterium]|nr:MATE family efflux transporter [Roseburia sp.]MDD7636177.1 MATE family efflux transporter [Clostridiales bacterium]MDY4111624.1 MATE family efflux transporter [Roseburia sp.]
MNRFRKRYIGDKAFYKMILVIAFPILVQNGITNFVGLLDNIMVGQLGTEQMSGVAIVNQVMNVFNICIFGAVSGASIFSAQFYGQGNHEGVRNTFRFKLICCSLITLLWMGIFLLFGSGLINMFLHDDGAGDIAMTHAAGMEYLLVMLIGIIPYMLTQVYASTLRETGETLLPMIAGIVAVCINLCLNYLLIFGKLGCPKLGVVGAAVATVISRFFEIGIIAIWTHRQKERNVFIQDAYRTMHIPGSLVKQIILKGMPLLINETLWSAGQAILIQCYSMRGLSAVAALNISTTVSNLFNIVFIALGSAISIVVGQQLGAGELEKAVDTDRKMIFFSVACCVGIGGLLFACAPLFPEIYNTSAEVRSLATGLIKISSIFMPLYAFYHASYFTLRTGGKTIITFLFDSCYVWAINIPVAFILSRFTGIPLLPIFFVCQSVEIFKAVVGFVLLKKKVWVNNIVETIG